MERWRTAGVSSEGRRQDSNRTRDDPFSRDATAERSAVSAPLLASRLNGVPRPYFTSSVTLAEWLLNSGAYMHCDARQPGRVRALVLHPHRVLEHVRPLRQVVDEEVARRVLRDLVVRQPVLVLVPDQHVHRLGAAAAVVLQVDVLHVPVRPQDHPHDQLVADGDRRP